jgi:hypothetical protein
VVTCPGNGLRWVEIRISLLDVLAICKTVAIISQSRAIFVSEYLEMDANIVGKLVELLQGVSLAVFTQALLGVDVEPSHFLPRTTGAVNDTGPKRQCIVVGEEVRR